MKKTTTNDFSEIISRFFQIDGCSDWGGRLGRDDCESNRNILFCICTYPYLIKWTTEGLIYLTLPFGGIWIKKIQIFVVVGLIFFNWCWFFVFVFVFGGHVLRQSSLFQNDPEWYPIELIRIGLGGGEPSLWLAIFVLEAREGKKG